MVSDKTIKVVGGIATEYDFGLSLLGGLAAYSDAVVPKPSPRSADWDAAARCYLSAFSAAVSQSGMLGSFAPCKAHSEAESWMYHREL